MVGVIVDRPMSENDIGTLGLENLAECLIVGRVDDRLAVELIRVERPRLQDFAGFFGLCNTGEAGVARRPFALVQVKKDRLVPQVCVAGDCPATTVLGITRMAARDD